MRHASRHLFVAALSALSIGLAGCGQTLVAPLTVAKRTATPVAPVAAPAPVQAPQPSTLPYDASAQPDFGSATIAPLVPMAGQKAGDPDVPDAIADGADFALHQAAQVRNQIIVKVQPGQGLAVARFGASTGLRSVQSVDLGSQYQVVTLPAGMSAEEGMAIYGKASGVQSVMPNRIYGVADGAPEPNDPYYGKQWGMDQVDAPTAWTQRVDCSGVMVAVLDTGVDYRHPELAGRVLAGWNFADNNNDIMDRFGHGTHVAGIIGATGNNGIGVAGVATNVRILAIKVLGDNGQGSTAAVINGIKYAADAGAKVINMSLGSPDTTIDPAISDAIAYANRKGVIVVAAAGNNGGEVGSPANDPGAIAVSSTSKFLWWEYLSWFSNRGAKIEVSAPGGSIWSTVPLDANKTGSTGYGKLSGTSMAAPVVTGEAALIIAKHPNWSPSQVQWVIDNAVDHKGADGRNSRFGFGRINIAKALAY